MIENVRTQHDDGTATVLSAVLEATGSVEKKVKMDNSGEPDSLLYEFGNSYGTFYTREIFSFLGILSWESLSPMFGLFFKK